MMMTLEIHWHSGTVALAVPAAAVLHVASVFTLQAQNTATVTSHAKLLLGGVAVNSTTAATGADAAHTRSSAVVGARTTAGIATELTAWSTVPP